MESWGRAWNRVLGWGMEWSFGVVTCSVLELGMEWCAF